jgi:hypothetical protein
MENRMVDDKKAQASLQIGANSLKVEGAEDFVEQMVERLGLVDLVAQLDFSSGGPVASSPPHLAVDAQASAGLLPRPDEVAKSALADFDEVYVETDGGFSIIADVEENTIAKTARNYILLHLYGCYLLGRTEVGDDELRSVCVQHACYDPGNFAHHVKGLGSKVHRIGNARTYSLKLTAPGIRASRQFAEETQKRAMSS